MTDSLRSESKLVTPEEFLPVAILSDTMAVDTETTDIEKTDIRDGSGFAYGISAAVLRNNIYYSTYVPVRHTKGNVSDELRDNFFDVIRTRKRIVFHNAKFDLPSMKTTGYSGGYIRWYCTMLMAHMLNENIPKGLDWLAKYELKEPGKNKPPLWEFMFAIHGWHPDFPAEVMALYAAEDAVLTLKLFYRLYPYFKKSGFDGQMPGL